MIKIEHAVMPSPEQLEFAIEGMRNPMNSWHMSDSKYVTVGDDTDYILGDADEDLMLRLTKAGTEHRKFLRQLPVMCRITAPLYWWKEFDTYKIGTVSNSCSTMHKITAKEFTLSDFSCEHLVDAEDIFKVEESTGMKFNDLWVDLSSIYNDSELRSPVGILQTTIDALNQYRKLYLESKKDVHQVAARTNLNTKDIWWQMIQLLPSSYNQTRNVSMNYEVLMNVHSQRKNHKLDEWRIFCEWMVNKVPSFRELIAEVE